MHSDPRKRGRQIAEENSRRRAQDLYNFLVNSKQMPAGTNAWISVRDWMKVEFYRGIDYGRRLERGRQ